jgi:3-oxoacyl-[acyl-carrier protein] reductase
VSCGAKVIVGHMSQRLRRERSPRHPVSRSAEIAQFDVADTARASAAVSEIAKRLGRLDILVANAGISIDALALRLKDDDFDRVLSVNLKGAIACATAALRPMMRAKTGRILFLSSVVGEMGNIGQTAYAASKAGLLGAAKSLAREYASRGITVNAVAWPIERRRSAARRGQAGDAVVAPWPGGHRQGRGADDIWLGRGWDVTGHTS